MPQPRSITGARRDEALRRLAAGETPQQVADALGASRGSVLRLKGREAKTAARRAAEPPQHRAPTSPNKPTTGPAPAERSSETTEQILDEDVQARIRARDRLERMLNAAEHAKDALEVARLTAQLNTTLDGLRRAVAVAPVVDEEGVDEEVAAFDQMMMRLVDKARRVHRGAVVGLPGEPEPAGEVGARARDAG